MRMKISSTILNTYATSEINIVLSRSFMTGSYLCNMLRLHNKYTDMADLSSVGDMSSRDRKVLTPYYIHNTLYMHALNTFTKYACITDSLRISVSSGYCLFLWVWICLFWQKLTRLNLRSGFLSLLDSWFDITKICSRVGGDVTVENEEENRWHFSANPPVSLPSRSHPVCYYYRN